MKDRIRIPEKLQGRVDRLVRHYQDRIRSLGVGTFHDGWSEE